VDTYRCAHIGQHPYLLSLRPDGLDQSLTLHLFEDNLIRWVVKDEEYPGPLRAPLMRLEDEGILVPCASQSIEIRQGNVIRGTPERETITLVGLKR